jgi:hypothetical protein
MSVDSHTEKISDNEVVIIVNSSFSPSPSMISIDMPKAFRGFGTKIYLSKSSLAELNIDERRVHDPDISILLANLLFGINPYEKSVNLPSYTREDYK